MSNVKIKHQKRGEFIRKVWRDHYIVYLAPFGWYKYHSYHLIQEGLLKISLQWNAITLTLFRMGIFGAAYGWGKKAPSLKSVTHILQWWNLAVITYLKKIQKIHESRDTPPEFCWHWHFFTGNQQILLYQDIQI